VHLYTNFSANSKKSRAFTSAGKLTTYIDSFPRAILQRPGHESRVPSSYGLILDIDPEKFTFTPQLIFSVLMYYLTVRAGL